MTEPLRHINKTQEVTPVDFRPILKHEQPYYTTINRPAKDAYDYADSINKIYSYGGSVNRLKQAVDTSIHTFKLYDLVKITDEEYVVEITKFDAPTARYGIVVGERDEEDLLTICTFCPNFVYPTDTFSIGNIGKKLYANNGSPSTFNWQFAPTGENPIVPLAIVTGKKTIFFSGTLRSLIS